MVCEFYNQILMSLCYYVRITLRFAQENGIVNSLPWEHSQNCDKLRNVCLSFRSHATTRLPLNGSSWNLIFEYFFRKSVEKLEIALNLEEKRVLYMGDQCTFLIICRWILLRLRKVRTKVVHKINTLFKFNIFFFKRAFYKTMRKNVDLYRPQMTIWRIHIACWITKATNTNS